MELDRDVVPRVLRVAGERLPLDLREVDDRPDLGDRRRDGRSDRQGRVRSEVGQPDDERGLVRRLDVDAGPKHLAPQHERSDADDRPVNGRVDIRARRCPHIERRRARAVVATELVVGESVRPAAEELPRDAREQTLVGLAADRVERECPVTDSVVPDRRHAALVDRQLQPQSAVQRHDLRARLARRQEPVGRCRPGLRRRRRAGAEGGEEKRDEERDRNRNQTGNSPGSSSRGGSSLGRAARLPSGAGRGHARHRNRCVRILQSCTARATA
jgi:hypothetical protein